MPTRIGLTGAISDLTLLSNDGGGESPTPPPSSSVELYANATHHRTSVRVRQVIPDFIETEYPQFLNFLTGYFEFLEQVDNLPITSTFTTQNGVVTVQAGLSTIVGGSTDFTTLVENDRIKVGSDIFTVRSVTNATSMVVYDLPVRTYFANTYSREVDVSKRQSAGALRQLLTYTDPTTTLADFEVYFRDTYLRDLPQGEITTDQLVSRIIDFYQARGSEAAYRFLFRVLYNEEIQFDYPREQVFRTSDGNYEKSTSVQVQLSDSSLQAEDLETRQIIGLTSRARATVLRAVTTYVGNDKYATLYVDDIIENQERGDLLLNSDNPLDDGDRIIISAFGSPPEGLSTVIYEYVLTQEEVVGSEFQAGEPFSTVPANDPVAITGFISGSVVGFKVARSGSGYSVGDIIFPPPSVGGGTGASGRVTALQNTDLTGIDVIDGGEGYVNALALVVDNSGTGGSGLSGYVSSVYPGSLLIETNDSNNGSFLMFDFIDPVTQETTVVFSARETVDYFEIGISLEQVLAPNTKTLNWQDWSSTTTGAIGTGNPSSALYLTNLSSPISKILSQLSVEPIMTVNSSNELERTSVGKVRTIVVTDVGAGYIIRPPSVGVEVPPVLYAANGSVLNDTILADIHGGDQNVRYRTANVSPVVATGQIGFVEVLTPGAGYTATDTFLVSGGSGDGAELQLVLGGIYTAPVGRFTGTRGEVSSDQYLQDITKYQSFAYVLTVERDITEYRDVVFRHVHPAGGLLLGRHTVTSVLDVSTGAMDVDITIA